MRARCSRREVEWLSFTRPRTDPPAAAGGRQTQTLYVGLRRLTVLCWAVYSGTLE
jgi:hypothetical protein